MPRECQSYDVRSKDKMNSSGFAELKSKFWCSGQTIRRGSYKGREFWRAVEGYPWMPAEYRSALACTEIIPDEETTTKGEYCNNSENSQSQSRKPC